MGREISQDTAALAGAQLSEIAIKEDLKPKKKTNDIPDKASSMAFIISAADRG